MVVGSHECSRMIALRPAGGHIARGAAALLLVLSLSACLDQPKFSGNCTQTELACATDQECVFFFQNGDYSACSAGVGAPCGGYANCVEQFQFSNNTTKTVLCDHIACLADSGQL